jgi:hypothetical protein
MHKPAVQIGNSGLRGCRACLRAASLKRGKPNKKGTGPHQAGFTSAFRKVTESQVRDVHPGKAIDCHDWGRR